MTHLYPLALFLSHTDLCWPTSVFSHFGLFDPHLQLELFTKRWQCGQFDRQEAQTSAVHQEIAILSE